MKLCAYICGEQITVFKNYFEENLELQVKNKAGSFDLFSSALDKSCDDLRHRNSNGT